MAFFATTFTTMRRFSAACLATAANFFGSGAQVLMPGVQSLTRRRFAF
jgi:hypothetical protein